MIRGPVWQHLRKEFGCGMDALLPLDHDVADRND